MEKLYQALDKQVANLSVFFTKLHHFHWFVTGPNFYALHVKFEEMYDEINELYDEFAERMLMIGGTPSSTLKDYLAKASIQEATGKEKTEDMVEAIRDDFVLLVKELKEALQAAQEVDDEQTADLIITTLASFEKHIWMLNFTLR